MKLLSHEAHRRGESRRPSKAYGKFHQIISFRLGLAVLPDHQFSVCLDTQQNEGHPTRGFPPCWPIMLQLSCPVLFYVSGASCRITLWTYWPLKDLLLNWDWNINKCVANCCRGALIKWWLVSRSFGDGVVVVSFSQVITSQDLGQLVEQGFSPWSMKKEKAEQSVFLSCGGSRCGGTPTALSMAA